MIITRTPFRISFVGGGTDFKGYYEYNGGAVVSTAINKYVYVTINKKFDKKIHVRYSQIECVDFLDELKHNMVREALKMVGVDEEVEIVIISDIPSQGSGLGSSSALSVGLINALYRYKGYCAPPCELAEMACELEIKRLKSLIGKQDQYVSAFGGLNEIEFLSGTYEKVTISNLYQMALQKRISWLQDSTLLFYLNGRDSSKILNGHNSRVADFTSVLNDQKCLTKKFINWLQTDCNLPYNSGTLVSESWGLKKKITPETTNDNIDGIIQKTLDAGAVGAKLCGAGGGGFLMVICDEDNQREVRTVLKDLLELKFEFEKEGSRVVYAD